MEETNKGQNIGNLLSHCTIHTMFDIHDNQNVYISNAEKNDERETSVATDTPDPFPELSTPQARELLSKLVGAGVLDEALQPVGLSYAEKGVLANLLASRLGIANLWRVFGALWGVKPDTLRSAFNKGMEQVKTSSFQDKINTMIR